MKKGTVRGRRSHALLSALRTAALSALLGPAGGRTLGSVVAVGAVVRAVVFGAGPLPALGAGVVLVARFGAGGGVVVVGPAGADCQLGDDPGAKLGLADESEV